MLEGQPAETFKGLVLTIHGFCSLNPVGYREPPGVIGIVTGFDIKAGAVGQ